MTDEEKRWGPCHNQPDTPNRPHSHHHPEQQPTSAPREHPSPMAAWCVVPAVLRASYRDRQRQRLPQTAHCSRKCRPAPRARAARYSPYRSVYHRVSLAANYSVQGVQEGRAMPYLHPRRLGHDVPPNGSLLFSHTPLPPSSPTPPRTTTKWTGDRTPSLPLPQSSPAPIYREASQRPRNVRQAALLLLSHAPFFSQLLLGVFPVIPPHSPWDLRRFDTP